MSNYIKTTNFAAKDSLPSGNPAKIVKGTEINTEFDNIAVASATKLNSSAVSTFGGTLIDDANASAARTTLGLGTAATTASTDYATAAQGTTADAALPRTGGAMTGAITTNSTFDGRDVATDGTKLDGIEAGADVTDTTNVVASLSAGTGISLSAGGEIANTAPDQTVALTGAGGTSVSGTYPSFTITSTSFALPVATDTTLGGIELFSDTDQTVVANAVTTTAARTYGIQLNSDDQAVVNVPWTDTTYTVGDGGLTEINFTSADNTKLDGIEAGADVTDTTNVTAAGALMTTGGTLTGDLNFGDNDKATFGAGSDLEIYHDGSNSYIQDVGQGNLNLVGENIVLKGQTSGQWLFSAYDVGATTLYHQGSAKLATTSTGIDVTGTATMDGLVVEAASNALIRISDSTNANQRLDLEHNGGVASIISGNNGAYGVIKLQGYNGTDTVNRFKISANGDVDLGYEDTGTTAKLFWDASAESLTIDGSEEASSLATAVTSSILELNGNSGGSAAAWFGSVSGGNQYVQAANSAGTTGYGFLINPYGGNVGIGTDSPVYSLDVRGEAAIELYNTSGGGDVLNLRPSLGDANKYNMSISSYDHSGGGVGPADGISINAFDGVSIATGSSTARQERMRIDSSGNVGIGTDSPGSLLHASGVGATFTLQDTRGTGNTHTLRSSGTNGESLQLDSAQDLYLNADTQLFRSASEVERMRIDSSGNLLVGTTAQYGQGLSLNANATAYFRKAGDAPLTLRRDSTDGSILNFAKDGTTVGSIGTEGGDLVVGTGTTGLRFYDASSAVIPRQAGGGASDDTLSLGASTNRFSDLHLSGTANVGSIAVTGAITEDAVTLSGTATTIDLATATNFTHTLTGATTYTFSNPATTGNATAFTLKVIQDITARTITWPASVDWAGGTAPTLTATSGGVDVFVFYTIDGGTTYYGFTAGQAMA